jgi:hypothetical protein
MSASLQGAGGGAMMDATSPVGDDGGAMGVHDAVTEPAAAAAPVRLGHFELGRRLRGGASRGVYEAHDTMLDRWVALQVALDRLAPSCSSRRRVAVRERHWR